MRKKKPTTKGTIVVKSGIPQTIVFNCSSWIGDVPLEKWTRGPVIPVYGDAQLVKVGKRNTKGRKKRG